MTPPGPCVRWPRGTCRGGARRRGTDRPWPTGSRAGSSATRDQPRVEATACGRHCVPRVRVGGVRPRRVVHVRFCQCLCDKPHCHIPAEEWCDGLLVLVRCAARAAAAVPGQPSPDRGGVAPNRAAPHRGDRGKGLRHWRASKQDHVRHAAHGGPPRPSDTRRSGALRRRENTAVDGVVDAEAHQRARGLPGARTNSRLSQRRWHIGTYVTQHVRTSEGRTGRRSFRAG
ncbi:MAG: hypothetical protein QOG30_2989 [Acidimicrobiaceae bacterium]